MQQSSPPTLAKALLFLIIIFIYFSYFHKIPAEPPELEMKATYGLASPQEFNLPAPFSLWTDAYAAGFDVSKAQPPKVSKRLSAVGSTLGFLACRFDTPGPISYYLLKLILSCTLEHSAL